MVEVIRTLDATVPFYGNKQTLPYGHLLVSDGGNIKNVKFQADENGKHYFTLNRKRFYVENAGSLYSPNYQLKQ